MVGEEQQMIDHLLRHRSVGDKVPHYALGRLEKELADHSFESLELDEIGLERPEDLLDEGDTGR